VRVIIADDEALLRQGLAALLATTDVDVVATVGDAQSLTDAVETLNPDAVLVDIGMPELNGIEAARQIKRVLPQTKVLFVTQVEDRAYARAAFQAEASAYLLKQSVGSELAIAVREALAGRFYLSASLGGMLDGRFNPERSPAAVIAEKLTPRQREVLQLVAEGKTGKDIAATLGISVKTVEFHRNGIMQELGLRSIAELTRYAIEHGIVRK